MKYRIEVPMRLLSLANLLWISLLVSLLSSCKTTDHPVVGPADDGHWIPTRQLIRPAGQTVQFSGRPVDLIAHPTGDFIYIKDHRGIVVLDRSMKTPLQELRFPSGGGSMHGIAIDHSGTRLWATNAESSLHEASIAANGTISWSRSIALPGPEGQGHSHSTGIAISSDEKTAFVCQSRNNTLAIVDLTSGKRVGEIAVGVAPYDVILSSDGNSAYVSNWGGRRAGSGDLTADSSGTEVIVDEKGVAASGSVSIIDLTDVQRHPIVSIETGLHPSDMVLTADGSTLYVACVNSDRVDILDTATGKITGNISTRPLDDLPFGSLPNALALDEKNQRLYVANGGNNAVATIDLDSNNEVIGFIPSGWFPGALTISEGLLYSASVKGVGSRAGDPEPKGWSVYWYRGTVNRVEVPNRYELKAMTRKVLSDNRSQHALRSNTMRGSGGTPRPVPRKIGEPSVFDHVIYIIKENRTYDQVFGDIERGNGDPSLCIFGEEITPNHHALANEFVLLDNYYCNGVNSSDGHSWTTEGIVTDHLEKSFGGFTRSYTFGDDPLTYSSEGFIWDRVLMAGLSFRNYGEFDYAEPIPSGLSFQAIYDDYTSGEKKIQFSQKIGVARMKEYSCREYPGWNMRIPDVLRADVFLEELKGFSEDGGFPNFSVVYLPQDHTTGTTAGAPTPRAHMADNDLAIGRIVEGISNSPFWEKTCIFIIEDDPQNGFDHVDGHRSLCLVVSPYSRRGGEVIHDFYNQTSVLHTMTRILGVAPLTQFSAMMPVMDNCFTSKPNLAPYRARPATIALDEANPAKSALGEKQLHWALASEAQPFEMFDMADEDTLNRILWHAQMGVDTPYPDAFAGAHGKGLT
ncbi:MAG: bifunctional YncE family protein/alkaline phosphatase family protein, partial [Planctomycetota bacterium]|nr:bifunctional YncE family protein/alkaline phosphatase family protein [Planctomycetota bacterium]